MCSVPWHAVANTTVAREGRPAMAIAACFAGPLFNLLMGLSVGLLISTAMHGPITGIHLQNGGADHPVLPPSNLRASLYSL